MDWPSGRRYADYHGRETVRSRVIGLWRTLTRPRPRRGLHPDDTGGGHMLHREMGRWTVRPVSGWNSRRWVSKPKLATRAIPGNDREAAIDWMCTQLGVY